MKKTLAHFRTWFKFLLLATLAAFFIVGAITFFYKPVYSVTLGDELIGYSENKSALQERINQYIEKGNGENVAFVEIGELPEYKLCFSKKVPLVSLFRFWEIRIILIISLFLCWSIQ